MGEVLDHLLLSEQITRRDIAKVIELTRAGRRPVLYRSFADFDVTPFFIPKSFLPFLEAPFNFLGMFVPSRVREFLLRSPLIPARAATAAAPRKGRPASDLRAALRAALAETKALLEANSDLAYDEMVVQHPFLGANNVPQLLRFLVLHEQRHQGQISERLTHPQFPKAV